MAAKFSTPPLLPTTRRCPERRAQVEHQAGEEKTRRSANARGKRRTLTLLRRRHARRKAQPPAHSNLRIRTRNLRHSLPIRPLPRPLGTFLFNSPRPASAARKTEPF